jgi:hypothetical protein
MKKFVITLALALASTAALAYCTTHTYIVNGRVIFCTTCCYGGGNCTTTCN